MEGWGDTEAAPVSERTDGGLNDEVNNRTSLQSVCLEVIKRRYIYPWRGGETQKRRLFLNVPMEA
jgi:hypothetical protein